MKLFDRLKRRHIKDEAFKKIIQNKLDILAGMGIRAKDEDFIEWLLEDWGKDRDESDLFTEVLYSLFGEREVNGIWTPLSDDVYWFDEECIEDDSDYECIIKRLSEITKGELSLRNIKAAIDHDNRAVSLSFEHNKVKYDWNPCYRYDWFDENIITKMNGLLQEQGSNKFFYNSATEQCANIIFSDEDTIRELNKMVSQPFELV